MSASTPTSGTSRPAATSRDVVLARHPIVPAALVAVLVVAVAPALRTLYPILFEIGEDWSYQGVAGVGALLYASPVLAVTTARMRPAPALWSGSVLALAALAVAAEGQPVTRGAAGLATVLALVGVTVVGMRLVAAGVPRIVLLAGVLVGMAVDTALRGVLLTWDITWRHSALTAVVVVVLAAAAFVLVFVIARQVDVEPADGGALPLVPVLGFGGFLALQLLFLQSPAFAASQSGAQLWAAVALVLVGDALALVALLAADGAASSPPLLVGAAAVALVGTAVLPESSGAAALLLLVVVQVAATLMVAASLLREQRPPSRSASWGGPLRAAGAALVVLVVVFLWQFYVIMPLPVPRWTIPVVGAALLAAGAFGGSASLVRPATLGRLVVVGAATALGLALVVPVGMAATAGAADERSATGGAVRVMTYNIRSGVDVEGQLRPDAIASVIRTYDPDVVVLQEVGRGWTVHAGVDVLAYLRTELGMAAVYQGAADPQFGNAVLSRLPMALVSSGEVPYVGGQHRSYLAVRVDVSGQPLLVVGAHLEDRSADQIDALRHVMGSTQPAVIAGDFNLHPDEPEVSALAGYTDVVAATGDRCRPTSAEPVRACDRPDWIMVTDDVSVKAVTIGSEPASDHLPLIADLGMPS